MPTILLVHAERGDRGMYAEYLRWQGFGVMEVSTTDAAIHALKECDLMITGLLTPGSVSVPSCIEGAKAGRWGRPAPVIVVTGCVIPERHHEAAVAGADAILLKPCLPDVLLDVVRQLLART